MGVEAAGTSMCLEESGNPYLSKTNNKGFTTGSRVGLHASGTWKRTKLSVQEALQLQKAQGSNVKCLKMIVPHWAWQSEYPLYDSYRPGSQKRVSTSTSSTSSL